MKAITIVMSPPSTSSRTGKNYRAILWDNDGVLVDTERWYFKATREVLADTGIDVTDSVYLQHFLIKSGGLTELGALHGLSTARIAELRCQRDARYEHYLENESLVIAGVEEVLVALRPHFKMGIVTSSRRHHFEAMHRRTGLLRYFDFALTQGDYACSKPAPDPYLRGIERSGVPAIECLAIEDAPRGLAAARAAAIDCWVIPTHLSRAADFSTATRVLDNVSSVLALLPSAADGQRPLYTV
jgi:HAD superfamily hydrolase (TIGR01509 family)